MEEEAKEAIRRMEDTLARMGEGYDLDKARKYLEDIKVLFEEKKYYEIPNREYVFGVIIGVAKEKHQRASLLEKIKSSRADIRYLQERGVDVEPLREVFEDISELMRDKEYENAQVKFLELHFQITREKKALGEEVGENPLADPKVKKVIIAGGGDGGEDGGVEMLPVLEVIDDDYVDPGEDDEGKTKKKVEDQEEDDDGGIVWEE